MFDSYLKLAYKKYKVAPVHFIKAYGGSKGIAPFNLNLACGWR